MKAVIANTENSSSSARVKYHFAEHLQEKSQVLQVESRCPGAAKGNLNIYSPSASKR